MLDTFVPKWGSEYPLFAFFDREIPYLCYAEGSPGDPKKQGGKWVGLEPDQVSFERFPPRGEEGPRIPGLRRRSAEMVRVETLNDGPVRARLARLGISKENWEGRLRRPEEVLDIERVRGAIKDLFSTIDDLESLAFWILEEGVPSNVALGVVEHFEDIVKYRTAALSKQRGRQSLGARIARCFGTMQLQPVVAELSALLRQAKAESRRLGAPKSFDAPKWVALQVERVNELLRPPKQVTAASFGLLQDEDPKRVACRIVARCFGQGNISADDLYNGEARFRGSDAVPRPPRRKAKRSSSRKSLAQIAI